MCIGTCNTIRYQDVLIVCLVLLKNGVTVTLEFGGRREEGEGEGGVENTRGLCRWRLSVCRLGVERTNLGVRHLHEKRNKSIKQLNTQDYGNNLAKKQTYSSH